MNMEENIKSKSNKQILEDALDQSGNEYCREHILELFNRLESLDNRLESLDIKYLQKLQNCKNCGSYNLSWNYGVKNTGTAIDGKLCLREIKPEASLGCNECSETLCVCSIEKAVDIQLKDLYTKNSNLKDQISVFSDFFEWYGIKAIAEERKKQRLTYHEDHDDDHKDGEIANAAACYALSPSFREKYMKDGVPEMWPFEKESWKPGDRIKELSKAGALIAAEIEREFRRILKCCSSSFKE